MRLSNLFILLSGGLLLLSPTPAFSQEANELISEQQSSLGNETTDSIDVPEETPEFIIPPLFEYPVAPEEMPDLKSRTDYLMDHFWDPFDFKNTKVVDQNALNHAFNVYATSMPYANEDKVLESVKKLISKIKNNPGLSYQFAKAAEENLYDPRRASIWIDKIYIMFLDNLLSNKKLDKAKKARYEDQSKILKATQPGEKLPIIQFTDRDGAKGTFSPSRPYTLIEFGNPECDECHLAQFQLEISGSVKEMIEDGILEVAFIIPDDESGELLPQTASYPKEWIVGSSDNVIDTIDLRATPTIYILDSKGNIIAKNVAVQTAISIIEELNKENQKK